MSWFSEGAGRMASAVKLIEEWFIHVAKLLGFPVISRRQYEIGC